MLLFKGDELFDYYIMSGKDFFEKLGSGLIEIHDEGLSVRGVKNY